jgi:hypothetical protein
MPSISSDSHESGSAERVFSVKKDSPAFLHDQNAHIDQKILKLRARGGWAWYGLYWACIEIMRSCSSTRIEIDSVDAVAYSFRIDASELETFLQACVSFRLFSLDDQGYYSPALISRLEKYQAVIEQKRSAGKLSAEKRADKQKDSVFPRSGGVATPVQHPLNTCSPSAQHPQSNLIQSNLIQSNTTESKRGSAEGEVLTTDDLGALAESALESPESPKVATSSLFMSAGRRPMRKYPDLWMTTTELRQVFELYRKSGIPPSEYKRGFMACASKLATYKATGKPTESVSAFNWLTGFILNDVLEGLKKSNQLEASETYLKNASSR